MHHESTNSTKSRTLLRRIGSFTQKEKSKSIKCMQRLHAAVDYKALCLEGKMLCKAVPAAAAAPSKHPRRTTSKRNHHESYRECWVSLGPGYLQIEQHFGSRLGTVIYHVKLHKSVILNLDNIENVMSRTFPCFCNTTCTELASKRTISFWILITIT